MTHENHTLKFITGLLVGSLAGAAAAMLYAPQSGDDTRQMIRNTAMDASVRTRDTIKQAQDQVANKVGEVQSRVSTLADEARYKATRLKELGSDVLHEQKTTLEKGVGEAEDVLNS